jgi:uncharacterized membrane protein
LISVLVAAVAFGLWELRGERSVRRRWALGVLRVTTGLAALLVALQPQWTGERVRKEQGELAVLADVSRSMTVAPEDESRRRRAQRLMERWSGAKPEGGVSTFAFGNRLRTTTLEELADAYPARDDETHIEGAVSELVRDDPGGKVGAAVVVSDGAESTKARAQDLARHGLRVHAVAAGGEQDIRDDAVARVDADPVGFLRQPGQVRVTVRSLGGDQDTIPVRLRRHEQVVREQQVELGDDGEGQVELTFTPNELGRAIYKVTIPVAPNDAVPENNERAFLVRVKRDKLRVLLVAGRPSWDVRYLREFLNRDPSIDLISFFILRTAADLTMASPDALALIPFPTDELFREHLGSFDVVFFQNFEYEPYGMASYLPRIRDYVQRGGSFAMIGGEQSFVSGGYANTPIAEILPVALPPDGTPKTRALLTERFRPELVPELSNHPVLKLLSDPAANAQAWAELAPLQGANRVERVLKRGQVLLTHPREQADDGSPMPVLTVGSADKGRVLALGTDTSWRWGITTGGRRGDSSAYHRFWDRALRWLARDPALDACQITTDRERYGAGAPMQAKALVRDERYAPLTQRQGRITILDSTGKEVHGKDARTDGQGRIELGLDAPAHPGGYRIAVRMEGESEARCEEGFVVEAGGEELADPRARPGFLRDVADASGGAFYPAPDEAPALSEFDSTRARTLGTSSLEPFATPWAFLGVVGLFAAEWILRRRWGKR